MDAVDDSQIQPPASAERSQLRELVVLVLERLENESPDALEATCAEHPELADALRRRISSLRELGLIGGALDDIPQRVGDYRLVERIGAGGMGVVFRAVHENHGGEVAIKLIRPDVLPKRGARERFARETDVVARLEHPGIVPIYTVGNDAEVPFYAMERVRGCTLAEALSELDGRHPDSLRGVDLRAAVHACSPSDPNSKAPLNPELFDGTWESVALRIAGRIAEALHHAHERGVLHRDLKPSNVMLTPEGRVLLVDFGLSLTEDGDTLTRTREPIGSVAFMAPELIRIGPRAAGRASDIYALGVTLYQLLTLRLPFVGESVPATMERIVAGRADAPRNLAPSTSWEAETVCLSAMEPDPRRRYPTAAAFARDLGNASLQHPVEAQRASWSRRLRRWTRQHPGRAAAILATLLLPSVIALSTAREARRVTAALERAETERARADRAATLSQRAVDELLTRIGTRELDQIPGLDALRVDVLESATNFYDQLIAEEPENAELAINAANTALQIGRIALRDGDLEAIERQSRRALAILDPFEGVEDRAAVWLAYAHSHAALVADRLGAPERALKHRKRATALLDGGPHREEDRAWAARLKLGVQWGAVWSERARGRTVDAPVEDTEWLAHARAGSPTSETRRWLADANYKRGAWLHIERRFEEALPFLQEALAAYRSLAHQAPSDEDLSLDLFKAAMDVGSARTALEDYEGAFESLEVAIQTGERLAYENPLHDAYAFMLSEARSSLGLTYFHSGQPEQSLEQLELALSAKHELLQRMGNVPDLHFSFVPLLLTQAKIAARSGDPQLALSGCRLAVEHMQPVIERFPDSIDRTSWLAAELLTRAEALLGLERPQEAARALSQVPSAAGSHLEYVGRSLSLMRRALDASRTQESATVRTACVGEAEGLAQAVAAMEPLAEDPRLAALTAALSEQ